MVTEGLTLILSNNIKPLLTYDISWNGYMNVQNHLSGGVLVNVQSLTKHKEISFGFDIASLNHN